MDIDVLDEILAEVAAREVLPRFGRLADADVMEKTSAYDVVTVADREAEKAITGAVLARWPGTVIVGEESAGTEDVMRQQLAADEVVIIDPVDGTKNYACGLPLFAVMAGVMRKGRIVGGIIHDPLTRTSAVAEAGSGAWMRRPGEQARRLRVAPPVPVAEMEAVAGRRIGDDPYALAIEANLRKFARHPWFRCGGHEYRLVASGEIHALCYQRLMPWDHVPGWLLHREAGGYSAHFDGTPFDPARMAGGLLCAPDEASWQEIHREVLSAGRLRIIESGPLLTYIRGVRDSTDGSGLAAATDRQLEDVVAYADPMALRGLLYQLTGDEEIASTAVTGQRGITASALAGEDDIALLRAKAVAFLKDLRDRPAAAPGGIGPLDRLPRSLALAAGVPEVPPEDLPLWLEEFALDPYARGLTWNQPPRERAGGFRVVVIGAGMGGLNAAVQLKHAGVDFTLLEKNEGVGGTWFENRYPGARVDSASRAYAHIFGVDFVFSGPYCAREENQRYFDWVADSFGVRDQIVFGTEVVSLTWDEGSATWEVLAKGLDGQRTWRADAVISAVGLLSRPSVPRLPGSETFAGPAFHSARWPDGLDHEGKRVGVIGTGCSGVQMVPELARKAGHVSAFQRTPQWLFERPGYLAPYPDQVTWLDRNVPYYTNFMRFRANWLASPYLSEPVRVIDPEFRDPHARSAVNKQLRDQRVAFIQRKLGHRPELAAAMIPPHPPYSARPVQVDADYCFYDALLRDNVTLVTDGIETINETGIRTADGTQHDLDILVYATGFRANECLWPMEIRGRGGRTVEELWAPDGPRAYTGVMLPGFPNLFLIYGPNMNSYGGLGVINLEEMAARYALACIQRLIEGDERAVDVTREAYRRYNEQLDEREKIKIYSDPRARSYYRNASGRSAANCPFTGTEMWHRLREPDFGGDLTIG